MDALVNLIGNVPAGAIEAAGGAVLVSMLMQGMKRWFSLQSDKVIAVLLGVFSFIGVSLDALMQAGAGNPSLLGGKTLLIVGLSQYAYRFLVKPTSVLLTDVRQLRSQRAVTVSQEDLPVLDEILDSIATPDVDEPQAVTPVSSPVDF